MITKVLVANRGEIALRIFRTCAEMGIATVAIYSDVDRSEPHMRRADEAVHLTGATPTETYLNIDAIVAAAKETGADSVHPGYGFLAENADFARAVLSAGLTWIGPSPESIEAMGSKLAAKELMIEAGVPTLPGCPVANQTAVETLLASAGFPVVVKASAGGGGKGMRVVAEREHLDEAVESARREAAGAFGDDTLLVEKYLTAPRHIEIQVLGDMTGNVVSLHERECSIQRRHQKIIEEAPSSAIDSETRASMGSAAARAARAVDYVGAGTVEFLYQDGEFYFLEMNTRLQVEHPVTEMVTGLDLVRLQIELAVGGEVPKPIPGLNGHAIEARIYAEDAQNDFLPVTGRFHRFAVPAADGVRVDAGIDDGSVVSVHYDPMIAKVLAHAPSRVGAAEKLSTALRHARIHGSTTNRALLVRILEHPEFLAGEIDTHFLQRHDPADLGRPLLDLPSERLAAVAAALADQAFERATAKVLSSLPSGWRNSPNRLQHRAYEGQHGRHDVHYTLSEGRFTVDGLGKVTVVETAANVARVVVDDVEHRLDVARHGEERYVDSDLGPANLVVVPRFPLRDVDDDTGSLHAPMPGKVIRVDAVVGERVSDGDVLIVMEAMKMEHTLRAPHGGTVTQVLCAPDDQVDAGAVLVVVEETRS